MVRKYNEKMSGADAFPGKGKLAPYDKEKPLPTKKSKIFFYKRA
ncbi:hypothetical protein wVul_1118 [Wolbachia endosymbiont of Armadillidium vulgare str. wVulC]|uniref:Uncharacterized protein n=1 Tax=Wolbachia endosymbiont of Armadillidium arcangelii TaxID=3158571 RepID=A0AAU7Q3Q6_9RICK|nr:hypothetical protein [Wolbachia endosymbiont of Cylisticus convexus]KLT22184.1 hypothetical protein wVul_1118 [Wolbachia endosymbiont of Armadillidium vulgare str. wVulC]